mgnify:CR=1 FL=1
MGKWKRGWGILGVRWRENEAGGEMSFPAGSNMMWDDQDMISLGYGNVGMESKYGLAPKFLYIRIINFSFKMFAAGGLEKQLLLLK